MLTSEERARIERLESLVQTLLSRTSVVGAPVALGGDVQGPSPANVLVQIASLAGGGSRLVGVDNAGLIQVGVVPPPGPQAMGGDVTGTTAASVISQIASLAGAGIRLVAVDNGGVIGSLSPALPLAGDVTGTLAASVVVKINGATVPVAGAVGNVLQVTGAGALGYNPLNLAGGANFVTGVLPEANQADQTMLGDVTGSTGASVLSKIAALGGGATVLVAVNNAGNVISGGAPFVAPVGITWLDVTHALPPTGGGAPIPVDFDFDLGAISPNAGFYVEVRMIATTKDAAGVPGADVTGIAGLQHAGFYETRGGALQVAASSGGGNANPFRSATEMIGNEPQACDSVLLSGGLAPMNMSAAAVGGASGVFRVIVTNQSTLNAASGTVYVTVWTKVAP